MADVTSDITKDATFFYSLKFFKLLLPTLERSPSADNNSGQKGCGCSRARTRANVDSALSLWKRMERRNVIVHTPTAIFQKKKDAALCLCYLQLPIQH